MKVILQNCILLLVLFAVTSCLSKMNQTKNDGDSTIRIIFETDMGNDIDDALALDMLYKYQDAGDIELLGIMTNKNSEYSAAFIDQMNNWYGYPEIPIGIVRNGADSEHDAVNYTQYVALMKDEQGATLFPQSITDTQLLMDAHILYRKLLAAQPDHTVTVVSVGFSTNLARLLESQPDRYSPLTGKELVSKKVKLLSMMAGCFNKEDQLEYNVMKDVPAAKKVFEEWPTPVVTSPFEVGIQIQYPGQSIEQDFQWAPKHPMIEAYKVYMEMPYDRPTWDLTSVLYAVEGSSFFDTSSPGSVLVSEKGTSFVADEEGDRYYLSVDSLKAEAIKHHFIKIITRQPANLQK